MNKIKEMTSEMISGFGEEENTEYLPIKLKKQTEFDQNNNPIQKVFIQKQFFKIFLSNVFLVEHAEKVKNCFLSITNCSR